MEKYHKEVPPTEKLYKTVEDINNGPFLGEDIDTKIENSTQNLNILSKEGEIINELNSVFESEENIQKKETTDPVLDSSKNRHIPVYKKGDSLKHEATWVDHKLVSMRLGNYLLTAENKYKDEESADKNTYDGGWWYEGVHYDSVTDFLREIGVPKYKRILISLSFWL